MDPDGDTVTDVSDNNNTTGGEDDPTITPITISSEIEVVKTQQVTDKDTDGILGEIDDVISYTITVTNTGNTTLTGVNIVDTFTDINGGALSTTLTPNFDSTQSDNTEGTLEPSEVAVYTVSYTIVQETIDVGGVSNSVLASGTDPKSTVVTDTSNNAAGAGDNPTEFPITEDADINVIKAAIVADTNSSGTTNAGDIITYTISVENTGNVTLNSVGLTDTLLDANDQALSLDSGPTFSSSSLSSSEGNLLPNEVATYTATYTLTQSDIDAGGVRNSVLAEGESTQGTDVSDISDNGNDTDGNTEDDKTETIIPKDAELTFIKTSVVDDGGDGVVNAGDTIDYTFEVTNTGNVTIIDVLIDDSRIGLTDVVVSPISLIPGATGTATATYTISQADIDAGAVTNRATATGQDPDGIDVTDESDDGNGVDDNGDTNPEDPTVTEIESTPQLELAKLGAYSDANSDGVVNAGDAINYTFTVTNTGNITVNNLVLTDDFLPNTIDLTLPDTELTPGASTQLSVSYTIKLSDMNAGGVTNNATVRGVDTQSEPVTDTDDDFVELIKAPELELIKISSTISDVNGNGLNDAGDAISYSFTVTNTGNVTVKNLTITDTKLQEDDLAVRPSILNPGGTGTVSSTYTITQADVNAGQVSNSATVGGLDPDGEPVTDVSDSDNTTGEGDDPTVTPITISSEIEVIKTQQVSDANNDGITGGIDDLINYTITVTNTGNSTLTEVNVVDTFIGINGGALSTSLTPEFDSAQSDNIEGTLEPSEVAVYTVSYTIAQEAIDAGGVSNSVLASGTGPDSIVVTDTSNDSAGTGDNPTEFPITEDADINVVKTAIVADTNSSGTTNAGDIVTYTISVENIGNVTLNSVGLTDTLLDGNNQSLNLDSGPTFSNSSLNSSEGILLPNEVATYTATYTLTQSDIDAGGIRNSVLAEGESEQGTGVSDISDNGDDTDGNTEDDKTETIIPKDAQLTFIKTSVVDDGGDGEINAGDTIEYTFTVSNTGNVTVTGISIDDPKIGLSAIALMPSDLVPGGVGTASAIYTITQANIEAGAVINEAVATGKDPNGIDVTDTSDDGNGIDDNGDGDVEDPTETPLAQNPELTFIKTSVVDDGGDGEINIGDTIEYTFTVSNTGNVTVTGISIDDQKLGLSAIALTPLDLVPGGVGTASAVYTITQADIEAGVVINEAIATGKDPNGVDVTDTSDDGNGIDDNGDGDVEDPTETPLTQNSELTFIKTSTLEDNGNGYTDTGDTIEYTFTVTNTGNVTVTGISIDDQKLGLSAIALTPSDLAPGATGTASAVYTITQADIEAGVVINEAVATGKDPKGVDVTDTSDDGNGVDDNGDGDVEDPTETIIPPYITPSIEATKYADVVDVDGDGLISVGDVINYTITIENTGEINLSAVNLEDTMTNGNGDVLNLTTGPSFENATMGSSEGMLLKGEIATYAASYIIQDGDVDSNYIENSITVDAIDANGNKVTDVSDNGDDTDGNTEDDSTVVIIEPLPELGSLKVTKEAMATDNGDNKPSEGDIIDYTIKIINTGEVKLSNLTITDVLTDGNGNSLQLTMEPTFSSASLGSPEGEIKVQEVVTYYASYTITQSDVNSKSVINYVEAKSVTPSGEIVTDVSDNGDDTDGNTEDDKTVVDFDTKATIDLLKIGVLNDENNDGYTDEGETISYTFTITNTGDVELYDVYITDVLDGIQLVGRPIPILEVGETDELNFKATYTVKDSDLERGFVENQAIVKAEDFQGNIVEDSSDDPTNSENEDPDGDGNPDDVTKTQLLPKQSCEVIVYDIISPDGDGIADELEIKGIECYPNNTVEIYNRWGIRVFMTEGYGSSGDKFRGYSDGRATIQRNQKLPTGTYYYVLNYMNDSEVMVRKAGPIFVITD